MWGVFGGLNGFETARYPSGRRICRIAKKGSQTGEGGHLGQLLLYVAARGP